MCNTNTLYVSKWINTTRNTSFHLQNDQVPRIKIRNLLLMPNCSWNLNVP